MLVKYYFISILISLSYCHEVDRVKPQASLKLLCDLQVPSLVRADRASFKKWRLPDKDDLDRYVELRTGCRYDDLAHDMGFHPEDKTFSGGVVLEWQAAVRTGDFASVEVRPDSESYDKIYSFFIGEDNNNITEMYVHATHEYWQLHTPGILSQDRYVPFYLRIKNGTMVFGKLCDSEPLFSLPVPLAAERGDRPKIMYWARSFYGGKFLNNCP